MENLFGLSLTLSNSNIRVDKFSMMKSFRVQTAQKLVILLTPNSKYVDLFYSRVRTDLMSNIFYNQFLVWPFQLDYMFPDWVEKKRDPVGRQKKEKKSEYH